jgi:hypothetical protein
MSCRPEQLKVLRKPVAALAFCLLFVGFAQATPKDYCEAYARDFADRGPRDETVWSARQKNALTDCLLQFQPVRSEPQAPVAQPKAVKKVAKAKPVKAREEPAPEPEIAEPLPEPAVIVAPDIEPPAKPAKKIATAPQAKRNTLLSRFFKPKAGTEPASNGKPEPFSQAWLDYCERKYASFNRASGTYTSFKGVERKCLVTD